MQMLVQQMDKRFEQMDKRFEQVHQEILQIHRDMRQLAMWALGIFYRLPVCLLRYSGCCSKQVC
ncbi:MAG: hypothetical protein KGZ80_08625 [Methylomonas sp.]|nr:hypothetical protein [Methylomonas sp.]PPD26506.1 MAG: hypothetical protein CTY22_04870 [Methylomonas sp.]PPD36956.1 MAG: hypothetical protein CTY17_11015 [Methylomonas sp.]PPD38273.1 MAG: hypothetical protein CTY21_04865 [Methylomonas sp.]PPD52834.1 MAG: hypothetical protein CTY11_07945 [Methylomonas sp.]